MFFPVATNADDRASKGCGIIKIVNMRLEENASGDPRKPFVLVPTPGKTKRLTLAGGSCRGIFAHDGVQDGLLFAVGGTKLYSITSAWAATDKGTVVGTRSVLMKGFDANLLILGDDTLYFFGEATTWVTLAGDLWTTLSGETWTTLTDGVSSLVQIQDDDLPETMETLEVLGSRVLTSARSGDVFDWSSVGNAEASQASGFASSAAKPDAIVSQIVVGQYLFSMNSQSIQIWRAVGGEDAEAFDTLGAEPIEKGLIARDAAVRIDQTLFWIGDDRAAYLAQNFFPSPIVNREMELALKVQSDGTDLCTNLRALSYRDGSKVFACVRPTAGRAWFCDLGLRKWHTRESWGADAYQVGFHATAFGRSLVASPDSADIWTWDNSVYTDDGTLIERVVDLNVPLSGPLTISTIVIDMDVYGQPLTGQGSAPQMMVTYFADGGFDSSASVHGDERILDLGAQGTHRERHKLTNFGRFDGSRGFLLRMRWTDPVGISIRGIYVNEDPNS